jgi:hypothetical protein
VYEDAGCGNIRGETVDGVVIHAKLDSIDGAGQVLGQAGPCILRDADLLPAQGIMQSTGSRTSTGREARSEE